VLHRPGTAVEPGSAAAVQQRLHPRHAPPMPHAIAPCAACVTTSAPFRRAWSLLASRAASNAQASEASGDGRAAVVRSDDGEGCAVGGRLRGDGARHQRRARQLPK
tara:strand:- start:285 stop:602 length:318 start_codon:yes stop_codon:yes gene_type:complete